MLTIFDGATHSRVARHMESIREITVLILLFPHLVMRKIARRQARTERVRTVLVLRTAALGDVVLATAVLPAIRASHPGAAIEFICGSKYAEALDGIEAIDAVRPLTIGRGPSFLWRNRKVIREMRQRKGVLLIGLETNYWMALFGLLCRPAWHVGDCWGRQKYFYDTTVQTGIGRNHVRNMAIICQAAGIHIDPEAIMPQWHISDGERRWATDRLTQAGYDGGRLIAVHPGGGNPLAPRVKKNWPTENFAQVVRSVKSQKPMTVLLLAGDGEADAAACFRDCCDGRLIDCGGATSLRQLAALIERCTLLICNDSAPRHIAAAIGIPTVSVWGSSDPDEYGIGDPAHHRFIFAASLACRPCRQPFCLLPPPRQWSCMKLVRPEDVTAAVQSLLVSLP